MKKFSAILTAAVLLACQMAIFGSAGDSLYLSEQTIPYAEKAPTLDGNLSEWTNAAKFSGSTANMLPVACAAVQEGFSANVYMMWDETYLYVANEVTDTNGGRSVNGMSGDSLRLFLDFGDVLLGLQAKYNSTPEGEKAALIPDVNGILVNSNFQTSCFPVSGSSGDNNAIGFHTQYCWQYHEVHAPNAQSPDLLGTEASCYSNGNVWIIEQKIKWADLSSAFATVYENYDVDFPTVEEGLTVAFMPYYDDYDATNTWKGVYIAQNKLTTNPLAAPNCFGFKGTLGAKPAPETADATLTAGIVVSAISLAFVSAAIFKKH